MTVARVWDGTQWVAIVGAQGPPGPPGANGTVAIYAQSNDPGGVAVGSLWIDTDEPGPISIPLRVMQTYAMTAGYTKDRAMNPAATSIGEVAAVLATLIDDLKTAGIIAP